MIPINNTLTEAEWVDALPTFEIAFEDRNLGPEADYYIVVFEAKIEANRPLITIPINALRTLSNSSYTLYAGVRTPSIKIDYDEICLYKYDLYLERKSGYIDYVWNPPGE